MNVKVDIDPSSGFCAGVIKAISTAENYLTHHEHLYCLGAIVHNDEELARLQGLGLRRIDSLNEYAHASGQHAPAGDLPPIPDASAPAGGSLPVLIRAHGEPPQTYREAVEKGIELIDCTCPVVLRLQKDIHQAWLRLSPKGGRLLIFGKKGHAEVLGLQGQTDGQALIVESAAQLEDLLKKGALDTDCDLEIFSQTTKSPEEYLSLCQTLDKRMGKGCLTVHDTICRQVSSRHKTLSDFAISHDIIIFVSGKSSSNGKVLFELCRERNPRSYAIESASGLDRAWFKDGDNVGVCGATSTPKWLLEQVRDTIIAQTF